MEKSDLRVEINLSCKSCKKEERKIKLDSGICDTCTSVIDNLPVRCVARHAYKKIYFLTRYFDIFSNGMKNKWGGLNYIEICSGPGRCINREDKEEFDGTPLSIIREKGFQFINKALFLDYNTKVINCLNKRILDMEQNEKATAIQYNYNDVDNIKNILFDISPRNLNLVFIDPTDCSVPFTLIKTIHDLLPKTDFIINMSTGTDLIRNLRDAVQKESHHKIRDKYIGFLGSDEFFKSEKALRLAKSDRNKGLAALFYEYYIKSFNEIGYNYSDAEQIENYYHLVFTCQHKLGLHFWNEACEEKYSLF